jgi:hypothetical protein
MLGHLVPSSGGKLIPLQRTRVYLGRRPGSDAAAPLGDDTALCRLRFADGCWHADGLGGTSAVKINGEACRSRKLDPQDELAIGRSRFRIVFAVPKNTVKDLEALAEAVLFEEPAPTRPRPQPAAAPPPAAEPQAPVKPIIKPPAKPRETGPPPAIANGSTGRLMGRLVPLGGGQDIQLLKARVTVGRKSSCDVVLRSSTISSMHCGLELVDGYWRVLDLGSRNGVRVDGVQCKRAWLFPESRLSIADHRFNLEYTPQGERPAPEPGDPTYTTSLMTKIGLKEQDLAHAVARYEEDDKDEPEKERYNLLEEL